VVRCHCLGNPEVPGAAVYHVRRVVRTCGRVIERNRALIFRVPSRFVPGVVVLALVGVSVWVGEWEVWSVVLSQHRHLFSRAPFPSFDRLNNFLSISYPFLQDKIRLLGFTTLHDLSYLSIDR